MPAIGALVFAKAQERRLARLSATLDEDLERERRPTRRGVLRGEAIDGEVAAELEAAFHILTAETTRREYRWQHRLSVGRDKHETALPLSCEISMIPTWPRARLITAVHDALKREIVGSAVNPLTVVADWKEGARLHNGLWVDYVRARDALASQTIRALETGARRESLEAAADLLRLEHDVQRRGGLLAWVSELTFDTAGPILRMRDLVLREVVSRIDDADAVELDRELVILESTHPALAEAIRRDRLVLGVSARDEKGALQLWWTNEGLRAHLLRWRPFADYFKANAWTEVDELYRDLEEITAMSPPWLVRERATTRVARTPRSQALWNDSRWAISCTGDHNGRGHDESEAIGELVAAWLDDVAFIRIARLAVAARRFRIARGRYPTSHEEALGRAPCDDELDPFTGKQLAIEPHEARAITIRANGGASLDVFDIDR